MALSEQEKIEIEQRILALKSNLDILAVQVAADSPLLIAKGLRIANDVNGLLVKIVGEQVDED